MRNIIFTIIYIIASQGAFAASGDDFKETGHMGAIGALTDDLFKVGFVYMHQDWETQFLIHGDSTDPKTNWHMHGILQIGLRNYIGSFNYFAYGISFQSELLGISTYEVPNIQEIVTYHRAFKNMSIGPYIALERYFSGTNLMLNFWVLPVSYSKYIGEQGENDHSWEFFKKGAIGVTILF